MINDTMNSDSNNTTNGMEIDGNDANTMINDTMNNINNTSVVINDTNVINNDKKEEEQNEIHRSSMLNLPPLSPHTTAPAGNKVRQIKRNHSHRNSSPFDNLMSEHVRSQAMSPKSQSRTKSKSVDKNNNSNNSSKTKKKKRNSNNSNSTDINITNNDINEYEQQLKEDDREESPLDGIQYKETVHEDGGNKSV